MTTGSYEESLSIEGIPDHRHERFLSREGVQDGLGSSQHPPTHTNPPKEDVRRKIAALEKSREAVDEKETGDYDRGVRGSIASAPWEENAHAHDSKI
jgi:hypothetical protein